MATYFRPLPAILICALLLGCGIHPSSVRESAHRHLGPVSLHDALLTLGGKAFLVNVDYVYRRVGYQVSSSCTGNQHL